MEQKVIRYLNWFYYGMMVLSLIVLTIMYFSFSRGLFLPLDRFSTLGIVLQYIVIFDALITIPGGLYGFKKLCEKLQPMEDKEEQLRRYRKYAAWRIVLVSNAMPLGIVAFYLFGAYSSMLWVAAVAAIAWYFTKPTLRKLEMELEPKDNDVETY